MQKACCQSAEAIPGRCSTSVSMCLNSAGIGASGKPRLQRSLPVGRCAWNAFVAPVRRTTANNETVSGLGIPSLLSHPCSLIFVCPQITYRRGVRICSRNVFSSAREPYRTPAPSRVDEVVRFPRLASVLARRGRARFWRGFGRAARRGPLGEVEDGRWFGLRAQRVL